jgi:hypothetical protein
MKSRSWCTPTFVADGLSIEVALHQGVVHLDGGLDQRLPGRGRGVGQVRRNIALREFAAAVRRAGVRPALQNVDDAPEGRLPADGQKDGKRVARELFLNVGQNLVEIGVFTVHLGNVKRDGRVVFRRVLPCTAGLDLHAPDRAQHEKGRVRHANGGAHLRGEVRKARGVQHEQRFSCALQRQERGTYRDLTFLFLRTEVADRVARFRLPHPGDLAVGKKHGLRQGRLSGPAVRHQCKTSRVLRLT